MEDFSGDITQLQAEAAYAGTSWTPERRGESIRAEYISTLREDRAILEKVATRYGTTDLLDDLFSIYRAGYRKRFSAYLSSSSRCVSAWIAGPSNFPARQMNKRHDQTHAHLTDAVEYRKWMLGKIHRQLNPNARPIMRGDDNAADRVREKLAKLEQFQEAAKKLNQIIRVNAKAGPEAQVKAIMEQCGYSELTARQAIIPDCFGRPGVPDYKIKNNGAEIRRLRKKLEAVERDKAQPVQHIDGGAGIRIEDDPAANRVRIFFCGKPGEETRTRLKSCGYRWTPSLGCWQAYRNAGTLGVAKTYETQAA